jgi:hypothetical protein
VSRPVRRYRLTFTHDDWPVAVSVDAEGTTRCLARNEGIRLMQVHLNAHPEMPNNGWLLVSQTDRDYIDPYV